MGGPPFFLSSKLFSLAFRKGVKVKANGKWKGTTPRWGDLSFVFTLVASISWHSILVHRIHASWADAGFFSASSTPPPLLFLVLLYFSLYNLQLYTATIFWSALLCLYMVFLMWHCRRLVRQKLYPVVSSGRGLYGDLLEWTLKLC